MTMLKMANMAGFRQVPDMTLPPRSVNGPFRRLLEGAPTDGWRKAGLEQGARRRIGHRVRHCSRARADLNIKTKISLPKRNRLAYT
ncbi:hypothetical protein [Devosia sp.]|uniref:hypothetical protein n=1 Tax=Devosia sp. TaxID=1871048 RepID=UPI002EE0D13F